MHFPIFCIALMATACAAQVRPLSEGVPQGLYCGDRNNGEKLREEGDPAQKYKLYCNPEDEADVNFDWPGICCGVFSCQDGDAIYIGAATGEEWDWRSRCPPYCEEPII